ncbi:hypothetical protein SAMD00019534_006490, partial [Acytostelium subglobosum LB1]|uniref:hypothetical protein n=1 Tax=Acytostelium subglobosum LB1 TaxID=1410327 RepID=UPI0006448EB3
VQSNTFVIDQSMGSSSLQSMMFRPQPVNMFKYSMLLPKAKGSRGGDEQVATPEPKVVKSSIADTKSPEIISLGNNSFVQSAVYAYNQHMHLVVRPDDVWLALITQFSFYVNAHSDKLRDKFVAFDDKKELEIVANGTLFNAPYEEMAILMTKQIADNIKDPSVREWVMPDFTTTTYNDRVVGSFALMSTLKNYFDYKFSLRCGLPKVTVMGSAADWAQVRQRAERFVEFEAGGGYMRKWVDLLLPVLDQMARSAGEGATPDTAWWNRIASYVGGGSGPTWVSGWISVFMVFSAEGKWMGDTKKIKTVRTDLESEWPLIDTNDIPRGFISCPLKIDDNGTIYNTDIYAGHIVAKLVDHKLEPQLDWCILLK